MGSLRTGKTTIRGPHQWTTKMFRFECEFNQHTERGCRNTVGRIFAKSVRLHISHVNSSEMRIHLIESLPKHEGKGKGSEALSWLCEMADAHQIELSLRACPQYRNFGLNLVDLVQWYRRHGFVLLGSEYEMKRYPNGSTC